MTGSAISANPLSTLEKIMPNVTVTVDGQAIENIKGVTVAITTGTTPPPIDPPPIDPPPIDPPPIDPPPVIIPPPDLGDAVPWSSVFDGSEFGQYKSYRVAQLIPSNGLYIYFTVPEVTIFSHSFRCAEMRYMNSVLVFSLSEKVGDMVGLCNNRLSNYDASVAGSYPNDSSSPQTPGCILFPNVTYFWNLQWETPRNEHIYLSYAQSGL